MSPVCVLHSRSPVHDLRIDKRKQCPRVQSIVTSEVEIAKNNQGLRAAAGVHSRRLRQIPMPATFSLPRRPPPSSPRLAYEKPSTRPRTCSATKFPAISPPNNQQAPTVRDQSTTVNMDFSDSLSVPNPQELNTSPD